MKLTAESTVFNDEKVQNKFSELIVDADGIRTEVGKKVGNDEVISRINQSAESVSIDAGKVNISGVITAINNNTTTTIDGDKITTGSLQIGQVDGLQTALNGKASSGAENTALSYITYVNSTDGIKVHNLNDSSNYVQINSDGTNVYKGGVSVAQYGDTAMIGPVANNNARTFISGGSASGGMDVIYRNGSGSDTTMAHIGYASGTSASGTAIAPYYSFGIRSGSVGNYSFTSGTDNEASSYCATALGGGLATYNAYQTVVGCYNDKNKSANCHFVVGDGSSNSSRSNGFQIETGGVARIKGSLFIEGHATRVGDVNTAYLTSSKTISAGTATNLCSLTLSAGTWVITATVRFPNKNNSTYRLIKIATNSSTVDPPDVEVPAINGTPTVLTATIIDYITSNTTYYLNVQASVSCAMEAGSVYNEVNYLRAVRIA